MRKAVAAALLATCCGWLPQAGAQGQSTAPTRPSTGVDQAALEEQARELVGQFVGTLKPQLQQAMAEGGPARAIEVCAEVAPGIADALSARSGWVVKRVSLKARNASRATPDAWEIAVLEEFDRRQAAGEPPAQIHFGAVVNGHYRYLQAQGVEGLCLTCHGETLSPPVSETLKLYYPDDQATGYRPGLVRGAISLSKGL